MLKVGLVGCGNVAVHHLRFLMRIKDCQVVALADTNPHNAQSLAHRHNIPNSYSALEELLDTTRIDVLHVLSPAAFHYSQAKLAIDRGIHVFIEKPVALQASEVIHLYECAAARGVNLCPDFVQLFHPSMSYAISLVAGGGMGRLIACEAHLAPGWGPELHEPVSLNWAYSLPGGILHNQVTHPLYLLLYWTGKPARIVVSPRSFGTLPQNLTDHIDILLEGTHVTGHVTLSMANKAGAYWVALYCQKGSVLVDFETRSVVIERERALPRSIDRATANFRQAAQLCRNNVASVVDAVRGKLVPYEGLYVLLQQYYDSLKRHGSPPISRELAVSVAEAEETIALNSGKTRLDINSRPSRQVHLSHKKRILVTGASGYLGTELVRCLVEAGYYVRALVRPLSRTGVLEQFGAEIRYGDVRDCSTLIPAFDSVDIVIHAAAGLRGSQQFIIDSCVAGTANVANAAEAAGVDRVIYISSIGIYDFLALRKWKVVTEDSPLECFPERRGVASMAKRRAEDIALERLTGHHTTWTILRPSVIFGQGRDLLSLAGTKLGRTLVCFGSKRKRLRLIHATDVAAAVLTSIEIDRTRGGIFVLSHTDSVTVEQYLNIVGKDNTVSPLYIPYWFALLVTAPLRLIRALARKGPELHRERLAYLYSDVSVDSSSFVNQTAWRPSALLHDQLMLEAIIRSGSESINGMLHANVSYAAPTTGNAGTREAAPLEK